MSDKDVLKKLLKIAEKQQKIITKLAQQVNGPVPIETPHSFYPEHPKAPPLAPVEPGTPVHPNTREAETILASLPPQVAPMVQVLEVHPSKDPTFDGEVRVRFVPGKASDQAFNAVQKTVQNLVNRNLLPGANYNVKEVK